MFSSDDFAARQGATNGDYTHGPIHPEQMLGGRLLVPGSAHATPIAGLYLCGASCHPGPGVTFLPGDGAASEPKPAVLMAACARSAAPQRLGEPPAPLGRVDPQRAAFAPRPTRHASPR